MAWGWHASGGRGFLTMAILWATYAIYEYLMYTRVLCSGDCNIRIDLLAIYPGLLGGTLWVGVAAAVSTIKRRRSSDSET